MFNLPLPTDWAKEPHPDLLDRVIEFITDIQKIRRLKGDDLTVYHLLLDLDGLEQLRSKRIPNLARMITSTDEMIESFEREKKVTHLAVIRAAEGLIKKREAMDNLPSNLGKHKRGASFNEN